MRKILLWLALVAISTVATPALSQISPAPGCSLSGCTYTGTVTFADGGAWGATGIADAFAPSASQSVIDLSGAPPTSTSASCTGTTCFPLLFLDNTSATAVSSFSLGGTYIGINAGSSFTGNLIDLHVDGTTSKFSVDYNGNLTIMDAFSAGSNITAHSTSQYNWSSNRGILTSPGAGEVQLGAADVSSGSPIAQTLRTQGASGGSNIAGDNTIFLISPSTGNVAGGCLNIQTTPAGTSGSTQNAGNTVEALCPTTTTFYNSSGSSVLNYNSSNSNAWTLGAALNLDGNIISSSGTGPLIEDAAASSSACVFVPNRSAANACVSADAAGDTSILASNGTGGSAVDVADFKYNAINANENILAPNYYSNASAFAIGYVTSPQIAFFTGAGLTITGTQTWGSYDSCTTFLTNSSGVLSGTCTSALAYKDPLPRLPDESAVAMTFRIGPWVYKKQFQHQQNFDGKEHVSLIADDVARMDPRCVMYDKQGNIKNYEDRCTTTHLWSLWQHDHKRLEDDEKLLHLIAQKEGIETGSSVFKRLAWALGL